METINYNNTRVRAIKSATLKMPNKEIPKQKITDFCFPKSTHKVLFH